MGPKPAWKTPEWHQSGKSPQKITFKDNRKREPSDKKKSHYKPKFSYKPNVDKMGPKPSWATSNKFESMMNHGKPKKKDLLSKRQDGAASAGGE